MREMKQAEDDDSQTAWCSAAPIQCEACVLPALKQANNQSLKEGTINRGANLGRSSRLALQQPHRASTSNNTKHAGVSKQNDSSRETNLEVDKPETQTVFCEFVALDFCVDDLSVSRKRAFDNLLGNGVREATEKEGNSFILLEICVRLNLWQNSNVSNANNAFDMTSLVNKI